MRRIYTKKVAVVFAETAEEFEEKLNKRLEVTRDLASSQNIIYQICDGGFSASVEYTSLSQLPDCARDELELRGEFLLCSDCPYLTDELNVKGYHKCHRGTTMPGQKACNWFCEEYLRGEELAIEQVGTIHKRRNQSKGPETLRRSRRAAV